MPSLKSNEKRKYKRSPIELAASYGIPEDDKAIQSSTVINISAGGFCFETKEKITPGTNIKLTVQMSSKKRVVLEVQCVWIKKDAGSKGYLAGVQIINAETKDFDSFLSFYCDHIKA